MAIYLDSANLSDAEQVKDLGWVYGITTNPALLAQSQLKPEETLRQLAKLGKAQVYYQLRAKTVDQAVREAERAASILGSMLVLKLPPTAIGFASACRLSGYPCCVTAVYSPAQAIVAAECGARYVAIYVNRAARLMGNGLSLVEKTAAVLENTKTEILAASLKSPDEAASAIGAGARHMTLQLPVLLSLIGHPLSQQAIDEFDSSGAGIALE